jgi:hypothetical protein
MFALMAELGFFRLTGDRYQMTQPEPVSGSKIETALLRLASTEDDRYFIHPEYLVSFMSKLYAEKWKTKLERLPWMQRVADRAILLEEI